MGLSSAIGRLYNDYSGVTASAQQNWKYQKEMAQNSYQWAVADMEAAGLNPALAYDNGGASAGGAGGGGQAGIGGFSDFTNSATQAIQTLSNLNLQKAQEKSLNAGTEKTKAETGTITKEAQARIKKMDSEAAINEHKKGLISSQISLNSAEQGYKDELRKSEKGTKKNISGAIMDQGLKTSAKKALNWFTK